MFQRRREAHEKKRKCGTAPEVRRPGAPEGYLSTTEKTPRRGIRAHYKQLSEFERDRIIALKEAGWENWRIAHYMGQSDVAIRSCWQEWVNSGRFQRHDGSGRPMVTADREDRLTVRSVVTTFDSSLSTIRCATRTPVSTMTIHGWLIERNLSSYRPLCNLPLSPAHCQTRLQWCWTRSGWNHADVYRGMLITWSINWSKFGKKYRKRPSECFITVCQVLWLLASRLEVGQPLIVLVTL
ncbi:HTH_Tnp_Tc3_2 domain-containing protein [Trichonephila clavipes]|nr:HTH_Tnp_Tc3_2 domain-containing protein [Trichonephila clavipes]